MVHHLRNRFPIIVRYLLEVGVAQDPSYSALCCSFYYTAHIYRKYLENPVNATLFINITIFFIVLFVFDSFRFSYKLKKIARKRICVTL